MFSKDPKKVVIWDDYEERACTEISFHSDVLSMKFCKELLVVTLVEKVYVFTFHNMECIEQIETNKNRFGIVAMSAEAAIV